MNGFQKKQLERAKRFQIALTKAESEFVANINCDSELSRHQAHELNLISTRLIGFVIDAKKIRERSRTMAIAGGEK